MCYSARIWADYRKYTKAYGAELSIREFVQLFWERRHVDPKAKIPKALAVAFSDPQSDDEVKIKALIDEFDALQTADLERDLFNQRKRLADAERTLLTKTTKAATESKRIATANVERVLGKLADIHRTQLVDEDSRIFPEWYAPVMVMEEGRRVVKPMRYHCRQAGKPAFYDKKFPGTYNAMGASLTVRTAQILQPSIAYGRRSEEQRRSSKVNALETSVVITSLPSIETGCV